MLPSANTPDEKLAAYLHSKFCTWNHADGCSWFYEETWNEYAHNSWVIKARALKSQLPQILKDDPHR